VTESKLGGATETTQDMLFVMHVLDGIIGEETYDAIC
jgi:hypothetical protein